MTVRLSRAAVSVQKAGMGFRILCVGCIVLFPAVILSQTNYSADVSNLRALYDDGKYSNCEIEARRLLERQDLSDSIRVLAEQHLAFSLVAQEQRDAAIEHFTTILRLAPSFDLDPVLTSPKIITVFNEARLKYLTHQKHPAVDSRTVFSTGGTGPTWRTLGFPGWEQLYRGRTTAGISFAAVGTAALTAFIYCDVQRRDKHSIYLSAKTSALAARQYEDYNRYYKAEMYAAASFVAVYLASGFDVILSSQNQYTLALQPGTASISLRVLF